MPGRRVVWLLLAGVEGAGRWGDDLVWRRVVVVGARCNRAKESPIIHFLSRFRWDMMSAMEKGVVVQLMGDVTEGLVWAEKSYGDHKPSALLFMREPTGPSTEEEVLPS